MIMGSMGVLVVRENEITEINSGFLSPDLKALGFLLRRGLDEGGFSKEDMKMACAKFIAESILDSEKSEGPTHSEEEVKMYSDHITERLREEDDGGFVLFVCARDESEKGYRILAKGEDVSTDRFRPAIAFAHMNADFDEFMVYTINKMEENEEEETKEVLH